MAEELFIPDTANREEIYRAILPQLEALVAGEKNFIANTANVLAVLKEALHFFWVGCYFISEDNKNELVLGPFQGPLACARIAKGRGVCGTAWAKNETLLVPDVNRFEGHITCSSRSKSEIVIPLRKSDGSVFGVLDIDSEKEDDFSESDKKYLEEIAFLLGRISNE